MSNRKTQHIQIILFLVTSLLGAISYSSELLESTSHESSPTVKNKKSLVTISENSVNDEIPNKIYTKTSEKFTISNPNLLNIKGPDVSLVFKQTEANEIFEYLAEIGSYGFVWVKNNPTDDDSDNNRSITLTLKDYYCQALLL